MGDKQVNDNFGTINYKLWHNEDLPKLLSEVRKWLVKHPNIHIYDVVIGGATRLDDDWEATIYYLGPFEEE